MASILIGAGALAYDQIKKSKEKRAERRAHNDARFAALERETSARLASGTGNTSGTCPCERATWPGGDCPSHGYVPPADTSFSAVPKAQSKPGTPVSRRASRAKNNVPTKYTTPPISPSFPPPGQFYDNAPNDANAEEPPIPTNRGNPSSTDLPAISPGTMAPSSLPHRSSNQPSTNSTTHISSFPPPPPPPHNTKSPSPHPTKPLNKRPSTTSTTTTASHQHMRRPSLQSTTSSTVTSGYFVTISSDPPTRSKSKAELKKERKAEKERERARGGNSNFNAMYHEAVKMRDTERGASSRSGGGRSTSGDGGGSVIGVGEGGERVSGGGLGGWDEEGEDGMGYVESREGGRERERETDRETDRDYRETESQAEMDRRERETENSLDHQQRERERQRVQEIDRFNEQQRTKLANVASSGGGGGGGGGGGHWWSRKKKHPLSLDHDGRKSEVSIGGGGGGGARMGVGSGNAGVVR